MSEEITDKDITDFVELANALASNELDAKREARGDVKCESCGCWTRDYALTADECYICPTCAKGVPMATEAELMAYGHIDARPHLSPRPTDTEGHNG